MDNRKHAILCVAASMLALIPVRFAVAADVDVDRLLWQKPQVALESIDRDATRVMVMMLRDEVDGILQAGPLAALRLLYADVHEEGYFLYYERGRIITTLARAYPYVDEKRRDDIKEYVRNLLAEEEHQPWRADLKSVEAGNPRALHGYQLDVGRYPQSRNTPTLHVLYGLWLYADTTGDWEPIRSNWDAIKTHWSSNLQKELMIYSQIGGHIAIARMAKRFGDDETLATSKEIIARDMASALHLATDEELQSYVDALNDEDKRDHEPARLPTMDARLTATRYGTFLYSGGRRNGMYVFFRGVPFLFIDAPPELWRYLNEHAKDILNNRYTPFLIFYEKWWQYAYPKFTRWTGDEGVGVAPEIFGMVMPYKRWVAETKPEEMSLYMRSTPTGIGDCYWIEALVDAIESHGTTEWVSVTD